LPQAGQLARIFECDFAVPGPAQRGRAMSEGPALLMQHGRAAADADNRCVSGGTVRLFACLYGRHGRFLEGTRGVETILVSFMSPQQPVNSTECTGIPQKQHKWKTLKK
jgi:hypothetical protein